jgi:hypothetical protein
MRSEFVSKARKKKEDYIEIKKRMRSFAFLRLQASVTHIRDLLASADLYNEFPHTIKNEVFFDYAYKKFQNKESRDFDDENITDFVLRLDLGRNLDFLNELAFLHLVNSFVSYCADILAMSALGSPDKFDFTIKSKSSALLRVMSPTKWAKEVAIMIASRILFMPYTELKKELLLKMRFGKSVSRKFEILDRAIRKRNKFTHGLGVSSLAIDIHETGGWQPRQNGLHPVWLTPA